MRRVLLILSMALVMGCSDTAETTTTAEGALAVSEKASGDEVSLDPLGTASALPIIEPPTRTRSRLNIDQLSASLERVTGGLNWTEGEAVLWEQLSATLGKPDFSEITQEDLLPSQLFHKFLDDAARQVCAKLIDVEVSGEAENMHLMVHVSTEDTLASDEAIEANLRHLILAFHGKRLEPHSPELIHWRWLVDTVAATSTDPTAPWNAVCVALITHPRFYSY